MKIDVTKIEGYESMSAEDKLKALEEYEFDENPKDENKWKELVNKATAEASKYKKELREKQTEAERIEAERKEIEAKKDAELEELRREKLVAEHKANFLKVGYSEELAGESATAIANGDFQTIFTNLTTFLTEKEKAIKEELVKSTPKPRTNSSNEIVTKEMFDNMTLAERNKLFTENKALYEQLKGD